jgi:hypothetical protein
MLSQAQFEHKMKELEEHHIFQKFNTVLIEVLAGWITCINSRNVKPRFHYSS